MDDNGRKTTPSVRRPKRPSSALGLLDTRRQSIKLLPSTSTSVGTEYLDLQPDSGKPVNHPRTAETSGYEEQCSDLTSFGNPAEFLDSSIRSPTTSRMAATYKSSSSRRWLFGRDSKNETKEENSNLNAYFAPLETPESHNMRADVSTASSTALESLSFVRSKASYMGLSLRSTPGKSSSLPSSSIKFPTASVPTSPTSMIFNSIPRKTKVSLGAASITSIGSSSITGTSRVASISQPQIDNDVVFSVSPTAISVLSGSTSPAMKLLKLRLAEEQKVQLEEVESSVSSTRRSRAETGSSCASIMKNDTNIIRERDTAKNEEEDEVEVLNDNAIEIVREKKEYVKMDDNIEPVNVAPDCEKAKPEPPESAKPGNTHLLVRLINSLVKLLVFFILFPLRALLSFFSRVYRVCVTVASYPSTASSLISYHITEPIHMAARFFLFRAVKIVSLMAGAFINIIFFPFRFTIFSIFLIVQTASRFLEFFRWVFRRGPGPNGAGLGSSPGAPSREREIGAERRTTRGELESLDFSLAERENWTCGLWWIIFGGRAFWFKRGLGSA